MIKTIIKEPLVHFTLVAAAIFVWSAQYAPAAIEDSSTIVVNQDDLAKHMQQAQRGLSLAMAKSNLASLSKEQQQKLLADYVEHEALFREAKKIGLDQNDHELKRRMVQRMQMLLEGVEAAEQPTEQQLEAFYADNKGQYQIPAKYSFKHSFYKFDDAIPALNRAEQAIREPNTAPSTTKADPFPYHKAYLDRNAAQISAHFGAEFAQQLSQLKPQTGVWQGPLKSAYGYHLVNLTSAYPQRNPALQEIKTRLLKDYLRTANSAKRREVVVKLVNQYQVVAPDFNN